MVQFVELTGFEPVRWLSKGAPGKPASPPGGGGNQRSNHERLTPPSSWLPLLAHRNEGRHQQRSPGATRPSLCILRWLGSWRIIYIIQKIQGGTKGIQCFTPLS